MQSALQRLVLVRHGETTGESSIRYHGATDVPLSDSGRRQMRQVAAALASERFDAAYSSALSRTVEAAQIIAPSLSPQEVPGFNEIHFGRWEGLTREEIAARDPELFAAWRRGASEFTYPEGDAAPAFRARVAAAFRTLLPLLPRQVLIVAHKGVIWTVLAELLHLAPADRVGWPIELASIHIVAAGAIGWRAEVVNALHHLEGAA